MQQLSIAIGDWMKRSFRFSTQQIFMYVSGIVLFSLGVKLFIDAGLGTDPLHAMIIGIVDTLDQPFIKIGFVESAITIFFLIVWTVWNRRFPPLMTFVTMAAVGYMIDFWNMLDFSGIDWVPRAALMLTALLMDAYASALIIMSGLGIRVMDLVAISMVRKWGWTFFWAKLLFEVSFVAIAFVFGGPIGFGTLAFVAIVGTLVPPMMWYSAHLFGLPNHGLPPVAAHEGSG
jgi:uncharacterized membrane protein YczE